MTDATQTTMNLDVELEIEAPPLRVFNALTNGIAVWWGKPYFESEKHAVDLVLESKVGGRLFERWSHDPKSQDGALLGFVVAYKHAHLLRVRGTFGMGDTLIQGLVEFELFATSKGTDLKFNHQASGELSDERKARYAAAWHDLLGRLKFYVEEGQGQGIRHEPHMRHSHD